MHTIVGVLSSNFGHRVTNLLLDIGNGFTRQASYQLLADHQSLFAAQCREKLLGFVRNGVLSRLGGYPSEDHCCECAGL